MPITYPIKRALISVSDKSGIDELAQDLHARNITICSTGGTATALTKAGLETIDVASLTGFPEILDGRVKTLHPHIHGGLLARRDNAEHMKTLKTHGIEPIDLLIANLYPFIKTRDNSANPQEIIENIDIGGPAMLRAAAKNHEYLTILTDPDDYPLMLENMHKYNGATSLEFRQYLAQKTYAHTAAYDSAIAQWMADSFDIDAPLYFSFSGKRAQNLRYGENPHQKAVFYTSTNMRVAPNIANARQIQGKKLSYNNINDADAAFQLIAEFDPISHAACAIIKHANPCGVARAQDLSQAFAQALKCDPVSAFGGIIALNRPLDAATATAIVEIFTEAIIAPDADAEAREIISRKKNLRLLCTDGLPHDDTVSLPHSGGGGGGGLDIRHVGGGFLVQTRDATILDPSQLQTVSKRAPSAEELDDLIFAFTIAKHVKSNAIIYVKNGASVGIGAGQMSRLDSTRIAAQKARDAAKAAGDAMPLTQGSVVASDAFFPFADGLIAAAEAGATAIIQPGGSIRDDEVIAAADAANLAMVFTGIRHFKH